MELFSFLYAGFGSCSGPMYIHQSFDEVGSFGASITKHKPQKEDYSNCKLELLNFVLFCFSCFFYCILKFSMSWLHISKRLCIIERDCLRPKKIDVTPVIVSQQQREIDMIVLIPMN
jgi:hypothetical protein